MQDVQEYISGKYSALITEGGSEDAKAQIKRYITKYVQDRRIAVKGYSGDQLVDALYTEMAEFGLLTKYIFGSGIEEINVNSWRDIEVLYANGETVKLEEHFDSPEHAVNVIRRIPNPVAAHAGGVKIQSAAAVYILMTASFWNEWCRSSKCWLILLSVSGFLKPPLPQQMPFASKMNWPFALTGPISTRNI